jgi:hypothetical protein
MQRFPPANAILSRYSAHFEAPHRKLGLTSCICTPTYRTLSSQDCSLPFALHGSHLTSAGFSTLTLRTLTAKILATRQFSSLEDISPLFGIPLIRFAPNHPHGPHKRWESQKGRQIVLAFCAIIPFSDRHSSAWKTA